MNGPTKISSDWDARIWIEGASETERRLEVTPAIAGWSALSFRTYTFRTAQVIDGESATDEMAMVLLLGAITMEVAGPGWRETWECHGRASVFAGAPYVVYLPPGHTYHMTVHADADCAYGRAPARGQRPPRLIQPAEVQTRDDDGVRTRQLLTSAVTEHLRCMELTIAAGGTTSLSVPEAEPATAREQVAYFRTRSELGAEGHWLPAAGNAGEALPIVHGDALIIRGNPGCVVSAADAPLYCLTYVVGSDAGVG